MKIWKLRNGPALVVVRAETVREAAEIATAYAKEHNFPWQWIESARPESFDPAEPGVVSYVLSPTF